LACRKTPQGPILLTVDFDLVAGIELQNWAPDICERTA